MTTSEIIEENEKGNSPDLDSLIAQLATQEGRDKAIEMAVERGFVDSYHVHSAVNDREEDLKYEEPTPENIFWLRAAACIAKTQGEEATAQSFAEKIILYYAQKSSYQDRFSLKEVLHLRAEYLGENLSEIIPEGIEERVTGYTPDVQFRIWKDAAEICAEIGDTQRAVSLYLNIRYFEQALSIADTPELRKRAMEAQAESLGAIQGFFYRKENMGELSLSFDDMHGCYEAAKESILKGGRLAGEEGSRGGYLDYPQLRLVNFAVKAGNKTDAKRILEQAIRDEIQKMRAELDKNRENTANKDNTYNRFSDSSKFLEQAASISDRLDLNVIPEAREKYGEVIKIVLQDWKRYAHEHDYDDKEVIYEEEIYIRKELLDGANLAYNFRFWEEAVDLFSQAAFMERDGYGIVHGHSRGHAIRHAAGIAREKLGDEQRAQELYAKATEHFWPSEAGLTWDEAGHPEKAKECYEKAGQVYEERSKRHQSNYHESLEDLEEAHTWFTKAGNTQKAKEMQQYIVAKKEQREAEKEKEEVLIEGKREAEAAQEEPPTIDHMLTAEREGNFRLAKEYAGKLQHPLQEVYGSLFNFFQGLGEPSDLLKYGSDNFNPKSRWGPAGIRSGDKDYLLIGFSGG